MGGLGINKDLEPLARAVRRAGGSVEVTNATHVVWVMPDGTVLRSGLTMSSASAKNAEREIQAALDACTVGAARPQRQYRIDPDGRGKFWLVDTVSGRPVPNSSGYPRTFSSERAARVAIRRGDLPGPSDTGHPGSTEGPVPAVRA